MSVHIVELICNVTVTLGPPTALEQAQPAAETAPAGAAKPPLDLVLPRTISRPEAEEIMASTVARQTRALAVEAAVPPGIDPQALAERVYQLMREELEIARERE